MNLAPGPVQQVGGLLLGTGVVVQSITENVNTFLETELQGAVGDQAGADSLQSSYSQLEQIVGALNTSNLSTSINGFFTSIQTS